MEAIPSIPQMDKCRIVAHVLSGPKQWENITWLSDGEGEISTGSKLCGMSFTSCKPLRGRTEGKRRWNKPGYEWSPSKMFAIVMFSARFPEKRHVYPVFQLLRRLQRFGFCNRIRGWEPWSLSFHVCVCVCVFLSTGIFWFKKVTHGVLAHLLFAKYKSQRDCEIMWHLRAGGAEQLAVPS